VRFVFSRNRACQLDALLSSLKENWRCSDPALERLVVTWRADSDAMIRAYTICAFEHPEVVFQWRCDLRLETLAAITADDLTCFFCDDAILYQPVSDEVTEWIRRDPALISFSARLGLNTLYCHPMDRWQSPPRDITVEAETISWDWRNAEGDFGYALSIDAHVMRSADLSRIVGDAAFGNPNHFEDALAAGRVVLAKDRPRLASYSSSRYVNIPSNRVNETHPNRTGTLHAYSPDELNERYLAGERIDWQAMDYSGVNAAHCELPYVFKRKEN